MKEMSPEDERRCSTLISCPDAAAVRWCLAATACVAANSACSSFTSASSMLMVSLACTTDTSPSSGCAKIVMVGLHCLCLASALNAWQMSTDFALHLVHMQWAAWNSWDLVSITAGGLQSKQCSRLISSHASSTYAANAEDVMPARPGIGTACLLRHLHT